MLSIGIWQQPYTVIHPVIGSDFGVLGNLWSQHDVTVSCLRLTATSNCFPHPSQTYTMCLSTFICCPLAYGSSLKQLSTLLGSDFGVLGHLWSQHDVITSQLRLTATSHCFQHPYQTYTKCLSTLLCCPWAYSISLTQIPTLLGSDFGALGHLWSQNDVIMSWLRLTATPQTASHIHIRHIQCV